MVKFPGALAGPEKLKRICILSPGNEVKETFFRLVVAPLPEARSMGVGLLTGGGAGSGSGAGIVSVTATCCSAGTFSPTVRNIFLPSVRNS